MRIAYLTNQYPKVSHTFIRREIQALEESGDEILRYTLRHVGEELVDPLDRAEKERTRAVVSRGIPKLLASTLAVAVRSPLAFGRAAVAAVRLGHRSDRGLLRHAGYLLSACELKRELEDEGVDHVHVHFGTNPAAVALLCHELGGPTYSFTAHGPEEFDKAEALGLRMKIHGARFVCAISSFGRSQLFRQAPPDEWEKVVVVRCGVDARFLEEEATPVPDVPRLVCVGRLCEQKGQVTLVDAAARVVATGRPLELVLVGDGEMRPDIERRIRMHGLERHVTITGWASGDVVKRHLRDCRSMVLPSYAEGLPVVIMEALAMGRPVLSTYVAGIPELVVPGECGFLVPAGSVEDLAARMCEVLDTPVDALTRMGRAGRKRVAEMHDIRGSAAALHALFAHEPIEVGRAPSRDASPSGPRSTAS
ncbi:MAG: glycosyltransferase family 4 protein [Polyangiales bacterium]